MILSLLTAVVMAFCTFPAGIAETKAAEPAFTFSVRAEASGWNAADVAAEWDGKLGSLRKEGLSSPVSESSLLQTDPGAHVYRQRGKVYMISCNAGSLGTLNSLEDAYRAVYSLAGLLGGGGETDLRLWTVLTAGDMKVYVFQHVFEGLTVVGSTVKIAADGQGRITAVFSSLSSGNPEAAGTEMIPAARAEEIVRAKLKEQGLKDTVLPDYTYRAVLPGDFDADSEDTPPDRLVWVVFSDNQAPSEGKETNLPYLAHYVDMNGTWLHSSSVSSPGDPSARTGYAVDHVFDGKERRILTGSVADGEGNATGYSVPVMKDPASGLWYLGDPERKIILGEFHPMIYGEPRELKLVTSEAMDGWSPEDIQAYRNLILAWDYYAAMGWKGPDGVGTPILLLRGMDNRDGKPVDNACYAGMIDGWQVFAYGGSMNLHAALDVMGHEFTHGVTTGTMNSNLYEDDYGAINESMSDILGNLCEMAFGATEDTTWLLGEKTGSALRSMSEPHLFGQPEYVWDVYYAPGTDRPGESNDRGGVHSNSSILSFIAAKLCLDSGMTRAEAERFWLTVACALTPRTDYPQLADVLPWALQASGNGKYSSALQTLTETTRMREDSFPERLGRDQRLVTLQLPDSEVFNDPDWILFAVQFDLETLKAWAKTGTDLIRSLIFGTEFDSSRIVRLLSDLGITENAGETEQEDPGVLKARILERLFSQHSSWVSSAESREIRAVLKQQATVYALINLDTEKMEPRCIMLLLDGEWINLSALMSAELSPALLRQHFPLLLKALKGFSTLLNGQDPTVRWVDLPTAGLEQAQLSAPEFG